MADADDDWRALLDSSWKSASKTKASSPSKATDSAVKSSSSSSGLGRWSSLLQKEESDSGSTSKPSVDKPAVAEAAEQDEDEEDFMSMLNASWGKATKPARAPATTSTPAPAVQKSTSNFGSWARLLSKPSLEVVDDKPDEGSSVSSASAAPVKSTEAKAPVKESAPAKEASATKAVVEEVGEEEDLGSFLSAAFTKAKSAPKVVVEEVAEVAEVAAKEVPEKAAVAEPVVEETPVEDEPTTKEPSSEKAETTEAAGAEEDVEMEAAQEEPTGAEDDEELGGGEDQEEAPGAEDDAVDAEMQMAAAALLEEMSDEEVADAEAVDTEEVTIEESVEAAMEVEDDAGDGETTSANRAAAWTQDLDMLEEGEDTVVLEEGEAEAGKEKDAAAPEANVKIMTLTRKASGAAPADKKTVVPKAKSGSILPKAKSGDLSKPNWKGGDKPNWKGGDKPAWPKAGDKTILPKAKSGDLSKQNSSGDTGVPKCPKGHELKQFKVEQAGIVCDKCKKSIGKGLPVYGCRQCDYDQCIPCTGLGKVASQNKGGQKSWGNNQAKPGGSWGPKPPGSPPGTNSSGKQWGKQQQTKGQVHQGSPNSGQLQRSNSAPAKITPIKPLERSNSGDLKKQMSGNMSGKITPGGNKWGSNNNSNNGMQQQNSGNNGLKRQRTDLEPIAARDAEGRQYDLKRIVVNFANVGATYACKVMKRDEAKPQWLFDWDGVRRCVVHMTKKLDMKVVGVIYENFWATDRDSKNKVELPQDIRKMCESVEETPRIVGQCHSSADDEMTIKCAYHRNCRFMDNDNYRDWKQQLRDERCRKWLDSCQDLLQMRYYFDSGVGVFDTLDGNIPPGLLAPDQGGNKQKVTKQELWSLSRDSTKNTVRDSKNNYHRR